MPEYLAPGVYVEEIDIGPKPIEGVSTSTAGFVGETERGPTRPMLITGFTQFERIYGDYSWFKGVKPADQTAADTKAKEARNTADEKTKKAADLDELDKTAAQKEDEAKKAADAAKAAAAADRVAADATKAAADTKATEARRKATEARKQAPNAATEAKTAQDAADEAEAIAAGGKLYSSYTPYAISGFFANGGQRCYVGRIVSRDGSKSAQLLVKGRDVMMIEASGPGVWGNRIAVILETGSSAEKGDKSIDKVFKLTAYYWKQLPSNEPLVDPNDAAKVTTAKQRAPDDREVFDNLSWDPDSDNYYLQRLHGTPRLITVTKSKELAGDVKGEATSLQLLKDGADGAKLSLKDYQGDSKEDITWGLAGLAEEEDISIVCAPNENDIGGLTGELVAHCELLNRFAILQPKSDAGPVGDLYPGISSGHAAFYYPWLLINDPALGFPKLVPPGGHVAGIFARTDNARGVHKAPANEPVRGIIDLQCHLTKGDQEALNPRSVNCIRSFLGRGMLVWGARTTSSDPNWKYVNVRRLFTFLEKSIERSTQWVVFEPNNEFLWARVAQSCREFLVSVWKDGALMGTTPEQAFFVKCDRTTMTQNEIDTGRLIVVIGVAPTRPAEFVIFKFAQWTASATT